MNALKWILEILSIATFASAVLSIDATNGTTLSSKVHNFKMDLHRALEGLRVRKKRQIEASHDASSVSQTRVGSATPVELPYLSDYKLTFWIPVEHQQQRQVLIGTQEGNLILFQFSGEDDSHAQIIASSYEEVATKAKAFSYFDEQWFIVLQPAMNQTLIRLYLRKGRGLEELQTITLHGDTDFDLVSLKGVHYLAVTTYQSSKNSATLDLYHWTQTQFDLIATRTVYGPRSVACWVLDGTLYIVLAQRWEGSSASHYGSPVFLYNSKDERGLVLQQIISVEGPIKVLHFYVNSNHYVIFIGSQNAAIYWWSSNQFLLWQIIENTANGIDASILTLANGEVVIVIALQEEVLFITLDSSGHYMVTFIMTFSGYNLSSFQFMYSGKAYYSLALFAVTYAQPLQMIRKLTLDPYFVPTGSSLDNLRQCLSDVVLTLEERQSEMNNIHVDLGRVWLRNEEQKIKPVIFVDGKISSNQKCVVDNVKVVRLKVMLPKSSLPEIEQSLSSLKEIVRDLQKNAQKSVKKSIEQKIIGTKHFYEPFYVPALALKSSSSDIPINDIPVSRIKDYGLRKFGDQAFQNPVQITNAHASNVLTNYVNDIETKDFLFLAGEQHVSGNLLFTHVEASDVTTDTINSIPFSNVVTKGADQNIRGLKEINYMQSDVLAVHGQTNGEILRDGIPSIVLIDDDAEMKGRITLDATSVIKGDIFLIGKINGFIDLARVLEETVLKSGRQQLKGRMCFESSVTLNSNLALKGHINNIFSSQLMTLSTNQIIPANLVFDTTLLVAGDLITDFINDVDLKTDAILKTLEPQFVTGLNTFLQIVTADFIDMTDYTTLDGVDPSHLVQDWVKHKEGLVNQDLTVLPNVVVLGNLSVIGGVNGHDVFDLPETVWLKQTEQEIAAPISYKKITATHMFVTIVNTINVDSDIVHSYGDEVIVSVKRFSNNVKVTTVEALDDVNINGLNTASFKTELEHYVNDGTIHGKKTIEQVEIIGDLDQTTFNDFDISNNIMRPQEYQVIYNPIEFKSELTVVKDILNSGLVELDRFNSFDLRSVLRDAVSKSSPMHPLKNKRLIGLKAQGLSIPADNIINDIPISALLEQVVTLDAEQQIIGEKVFNTNLNTNTINVDILNERPLSDLLNEIVYLEDNRPVTNKEFIESFDVPSITILKPINDIDLVQLSKVVFDKSVDNDVISSVAFLNGVEFSKLVTGYKIDDVDLYDLMYTNKDESLDTLTLMSGASVSNLFITGLVNGCDLHQIQKNALYANKSAQIVQEEITVKNIEVIGDVYINDVVNQVPVQNLIKKFILTTEDQVVTSDVVLESGMKAISLNLDKVISDFNLPLIMSDSVRRSVPQNINGYKKFKTLKSEMLEAKDLFVNGDLQNININDVYDSIIWKKGYQSIDSEKVFTSFKTDVATVQGHLNGLVLPDDIVRVDTDEAINSSTYFMSDLYVASDLEVQGMLNGVNVPELAQKRVTLSTNQDVDSKLKFRSDVQIHGNLIIDGMVNDLALEMVAKRSNNIPLDGYKVFVRDFGTEGSMSASSINGYYIQSMDQSILKHNREEFVKDLQLFNAPLEAGSHLFSDLINDVSLSGITSAFFNVVNTLNGTLGYLENLSYDFWKQLSGQLNTIDNKVSTFAYLILLQEINLGPTMKILKGYRLEHSSSEFSHSMIIWTSQKQCTYLEKCCHEEFSYWIRVKKSGHMMVDSESEPGKLYPIPDPTFTPTRKDFFIWTNARGYQPKWCDYNKEEKMMLASLTDSKYLDVFIDIKNSPTLSEIKSFKRIHLYVVAGFYYDRKKDIYSNSVVYVFNEMKHEWSEHQILPSAGVLSLDVTQDSEDNILLAVGTGTGSYSAVYKWDDIQNGFKIMQYISSTHVTSTLWLRHGQTQLLAMANVDTWPSKEAFCTELVSGGEINIYIYKGNIQWIQSIPLRGVISLEHFAFEDNTFLAAASAQLQSVFIYEWKGYGGFSLIQSMFVGEVTHLNTYKIEEDIYMTVATASGPAKVLKVVTKGKNTVTPAYSYPALTIDNLPEPQRDEAVKETATGCST